MLKEFGQVICNDLFSDLDADKIQETYKREGGELDYVL